MRANTVGADKPTQEAGFRRTLRLIATTRSVVLLVLLLLVFGYFSITVPSFGGSYNIYQVVQTGVIIGFLAIGETIVILSGGGGIDLSVGSMLSLSGMSLGILNTVLGVNIGLAVACAIRARNPVCAIQRFGLCVCRRPPV